MSSPIGAVKAFDFELWGGGGLAGSKVNANCSLGGLK